MAAEDRIRQWREHPDDFVREVFGVEPDPWQAEVLRDFPTHPRQALLACKGPGKSATLAWIAWNFLLTRNNPNVIALSISGDNLRDNLWSEMAKWHARAPLLVDQFEVGAERIFSRERPKTWWMSARQWSKTADATTQANTIAGKHGRYVLVLIDEAGGVPVPILVAADGIFTGMDSDEAHLILAGNTTQRDGALYEAGVKQHSRYKVYSITGDPDDPKRSPRVSATWAREQIATYGADNPWVLINVFGRFPPGAINSLLTDAEVQEAMARQIRPELVITFPKILGVDVARFGNDASVMTARQGPVTLMPQVRRNIDSLEGAAWVAALWNEWGADGCQIDNTGGFGSGWIDQLRVLNYVPIAVAFSAKSSDPRYANKRTEMYLNGAAWIRGGGGLPKCPELAQDLTETTYSFKGDILILEPKELIRARLGRSPDWGDSWGCTFAYPVQNARARSIWDTDAVHTRHQTVHEYDPLEERRG